MSANYDTNITVETVTYATLLGLGRVDVRTLTPGQLASTVRVIQQKIDELEAIAPELRPERVNKHIESLKQGLKDLVAAVNAADGQGQG